MRNPLILLPLATILLLATFQPPAAFADAVAARQAIEATCLAINNEANALRSLTAHKKLDEAYDRLEALNGYIKANLGDIFYDKVQEVRRVDSSYTPPAINIDLGPQFTVQYWQTQVERAETNCKLANEALRGVAAMRALNKQDTAFAYITTIKNTFSSLKDVLEGLGEGALVGFAYNLHEGLNQFIEDYKAIEAAHLAGLETEAFRAAVKTQIRKAEKTIKLMELYRSRAVTIALSATDLEYNKRNIANYVAHAIQDPLFPLDFTNALYNLDVRPYQEALDRLNTDFQNAGFCWQEFEKIYRRIIQEAQSEKNRIAQNIDNSSEPPENKSIYQKDLGDNWIYLSGYADNLYSSQAASRDAAQATYDTLLQTYTDSTTQRNALFAAYWERNGLAPADLRSFQEEDLGILQTNLPDSTGYAPYYLSRQYNPAFPTATGIDSTTFEMPQETPALTDYTFLNYGKSIGKLAKAYQVMAAAGIKRDSRLSTTSGTPLASFALSPLHQSQLDDIAFNTRILRDQLLDFEALIKTKNLTIDDMFSQQADADRALAALKDHLAAEGHYLCLDAATVGNEENSQWLTAIAPVLEVESNYFDLVADGLAAIDGSLSSMENQQAFNNQLAEATGLLQELYNNGPLNALIYKIVAARDTLPALPSEGGYEEFLRNLETLQSFYGPADLDRIMNLREQATALFKNVYSDPEGLSILQWFNKTNPYCVLPENETLFQDLLSAAGPWKDTYISVVRQGFPGWDAWARSQLAEFWPATQTDQIRPSIIHITPGRNSGAVSLYQSIQVFFDEPLDEQSLTKATIRLTANQLDRSFSFHYDRAGRILFISPSRMLPATTYRVSLTEGVRDLAGNALVPEEWDFTTQSIALNALVAIDITGVEDGGSYAEPVTLGITVSAGTYQAVLSLNGEPGQAVVSGETVSKRGAYQLRVTASSGIERSLSFTLATSTAGYEVSIGNEYATAERPNIVSSSSSLALGYRYYVDGTRYFYNLGGAVHLFDLMTGQDRLLFDAGVYEPGTGGLNGTTTTYSSFLAVDGKQLLFVRNTSAAEAPKIFRLFIYDLESGTTTPVPVTEGVSIEKGFLKKGIVIWEETASGNPVIYRWSIGEAAPVPVVEGPLPETWQTREALAFDGTWLAYKLGDGGNFNYEDRDPNRAGPEYRSPRGESLHALNLETGTARTLIARDPVQPVRIAHAGVAGGKIAVMLYQMHGTTTGGYWDDTCDLAWLYLFNAGSGAFITVSNQPWIDRTFQMSESMIYFTDMTAPGPYTLTSAIYTSQISLKAYDILGGKTTPVDLGTLSHYFSLFGDSFVTADQSARIVSFGKPRSPVQITSTSPGSNGTGFPPANPITVTFSGEMNPGTMTSETVALSRIDVQGQFIERLPVTLTYDTTSNTLTVTPQAELPSGRYRMYLGGNIEDTTGNALCSFLIWTFTTADTEGPTLLETIPLDGSTALPPGGAITLYFDEPVDGTTLATGLTLREDVTEIPISTGAGSLPDGRGTVTLTPGTALKFDTVYRVEGTQDIKDTTGNALTTPFSFNFRTIGTATETLSGKIVYSDNGVKTMGGNGANQDTIAQSYVNDLFWSPDGTRIYLVSGDTLQVMNADGSGAAPLATGLPYGFQPAFSADGGRILYIQSRSGKWGYNIISDSLTGGDPQILHTVTTDTLTALAPSPAGDLIAFVWYHNYTVPQELGLLNPSTGRVLLKEGLSIPHWSPDGKTLYAWGATAETGYRNALVALDPADLSHAATIGFFSALQAYTPSPTGRFLALFTDRGLELVDPSTGTRELVLVCQPAIMGAGAVRIFWTHDEARLLFSALAVDAPWTPGIYLYEPATRRIKTLAQGSGMPSLPLDWQGETIIDLPPPVTATWTDLSTGSEARIRLDWPGYAKPADISSFRVYRSDSYFSSVEGMTPLADTTEFSFDDTTLIQGKDFYYTVTAIPASGQERVPVSPLGPVRAGDNDGLDDAWEIGFFGDLTHNSGEDADNDGLTNLQEAQELTNPLQKDTDGDLAPDNEELALGMNPLIPDVAPIIMNPVKRTLFVDEMLDLATSGGSGDYRWIPSNTGIASIDGAGICKGLAKGSLTLKAVDNRFPGLESEPLALAVEEAFALKPAGISRLQQGGRLTIRAVGGSGFFEWSVAPEALITIETLLDRCTIRPLADSGTFEVNLTDGINSANSLVFNGTIETIPGDVSGDSVVNMQDALILLRLMSGMDSPEAPFLQGDADGNQILGQEELLYILGRMAGLL